MFKNKTKDPVLWGNALGVEDFRIILGDQTAEAVKEKIEVGPPLVDSWIDIKDWYGNHGRVRVSAITALWIIKD